MASQYGQTSRYYNADTENYLPQDQLMSRMYQYETTKVYASEENRLDLVSYRIYNNPVYWWIIARYNAIINPDHVPAGTELKIPRL